MKKSFVRGTWQVKRAFSPCVITEGGGRTIYVAGHTGQVDDSGKSLAADFDAQFKQTFRNIEKTLAEPVKSRFQMSWPGQSGRAGWRTSLISGRCFSQLAMVSVDCSRCFRRMPSVWRPRRARLLSSGETARPRRR